MVAAEEHFSAVVAVEGGFLIAMLADSNVLCIYGCRGDYLLASILGSKRQKLALHGRARTIGGIFSTDVADECHGPQEHEYKHYCS